jgi:hypothetical protein
MKYDFIEIGTSNFDTLIEAADDDTVGISIEPIRYYLDQLPNRTGVIKLNVAVSRDNKHGQLGVYYVPERTIRARGLPGWLRGCNCVGDYHPKHIEFGVCDLVKIDSVEIMPIGEIFDSHNVTELDYLKIDTEGSDADILLHLFEYLLTKSRSHYPKKILFETNGLADSDKVEKVKAKYAGLGYAASASNYDTVLDLQD